MLLRLLWLIFVVELASAAVGVRRPLPKLLNKTELQQKQFGYKQNIDVYFESLCPDSKRFITTQLSYVLDDFKNLIRVNLVPYGKASVTEKKFYEH
jgi:hypothetical protein